MPNSPAKIRLPPEAAVPGRRAGGPPDPVAEREALREVIREGHALLKDLRAAARDARDAAEEARAAASTTVDERLDAAVKEGLESYYETIREAQDAAVAKVNGEFESLADLLMGRDAKSRKAGRPDVPTLVRRAVGGDGAETGGDAVTDARLLGGDITGVGGPHDRNVVRVDPKGSVLLDGVTAAVAHAAGGNDAIALLLSGRVNGSRDRARVLYLVDADGAAALVTEVEAILRRAGGSWPARYEAAKAEREARLKESGAWE